MKNWKHLLARMNFLNCTVLKFSSSLKRIYRRKCSKLTAVKADIQWSPEAVSYQSVYYAGHSIETVLQCRTQHRDCPTVPDTTQRLSYRAGHKTETVLPCRTQDRDCPTVPDTTQRLSYRAGHSTETVLSCRTQHRLSYRTGHSIETVLPCRTQHTDCPTVPDTA